MNDHELDDQMRLLAQSYNEPPATPREAMWARIADARRGATPIAIVASRRMRWLRLGAGIAAVLVVGIGIGRLSRGAGRATPGTAVASATQSPNSDAGVGQPRASGVGNAQTTYDGRRLPAALASSAQGEQDAAQSRPALGTAPTNPVRATRDERVRALRAERSGTSPALAAYDVGRSAQGAVGEGSEGSAYRLAVIEHMARTEVLLTSFRAESRTGPTGTPTGAQFASLSRDLLKTTRLLLATGSAEDPALTRLLEDLELVLMQISQYTSEGRRGDLDAINQSLDRRNVLPKLRSTIPAGASASTGI